MSVHTKSAVFSSLAIHVVFIGGLLLFVLLGSCSEKPQRHVFELVSLPTEDFIPPLPLRIEEMEELPLTIPEIVEVPKQPTIPDITPPPPPPPPPPRAAPTPAPTPPPPAKVVPTPQPTASKVVTADQFFKEHGRPRDPTPQPTPPRPAPKAPQIDLSQIRKGLERVSQQTAPTTTAPSRQELEAMAAFERSLTRQIDLVWIKPPEASARGLVAVVSFVVQADGRITDARIARSSGNSSFDNSALQAVRSARGFGTPPNRQANTYTIPFRLDER